MYDLTTIEPADFETESKKLRRVVQRQITTIKILSVKITWSDQVDESPAREQEQAILLPPASTVELPVTPKKKKKRAASRDNFFLESPDLPAGNQDIDPQNSNPKD